MKSTKFKKRHFRKTTPQPETRRSVTIAPDPETGRRLMEAAALPGHSPRSLILKCSVRAVMGHGGKAPGNRAASGSRNAPPPTDARAQALITALPEEASGMSGISVEELTAAALELLLSGAGAVMNRPGGTAAKREGGSVQ